MLIKDTIPFINNTAALPQSADPHLEQQGILIIMPNRRQLHIHSIYIPPRSSCSAGATSEPNSNAPSTSATSEPNSNALSTSATIEQAYHIYCGLLGAVMAKSRPTRPTWASSSPTRPT